MIELTKIVYFEMAHAVDGYQGPCKNIHGHSYELHVTVGGKNETMDDYIAAPGFVLDFKELKKIIQLNVTEYFDHKLLLSGAYLSKHPEMAGHENLVSWDHEPTAENMLVFISRVLKNKLPDNIMLIRMKLYETKDSYAEWTNQ